MIWRSGLKNRSPGLGGSPARVVITREIVEDLTAVLAEFEAVAAALEVQLQTRRAER